MFSVQELKEVQLFLGLLFPWDTASQDLYKSVSWTFTTQEDQQAVANYAAQSMDELIKLIQTRSKRAGANVYIGLGTQRVAMLEKRSSDGFPKAVRQHKNIVSYKAIWLDIDVGKAGAYATTEDAFAALDDFCAKVGLPAPTMEVASGSGGIHVYWCTDLPMPQEHWYILAKALRDAAHNYGLKFDPQCTVNPAQILRVPHTFNHKSSPPKKVRLYMEPGHTFPRYGYQSLVGALSDFMGNQNVRKGTTVDHGRVKNFTAGVNESAPPVSIDDVAVNCMAIDDILDRAGDTDNEPMWNLALYAAAFTTDPHAAAHRLSSGHPGYTHEGTEKKLLEKINARAANTNAGWPTCESFSMHSTKCATCPLFAHRKSPFHWARRDSQAAGQVSSIDPTMHFVPSGNDPLIPPGYWRNQLNHVMTNVTNKAGVAYPITVINYPILDAGLDPEDGTLLYLSQVGNHQSWRDVSVSNSMQPVATATALSKNNGLFIETKNHAAARDFLVSWVSHLQTIGRTARQSGYGWSSDGHSFLFDNKVYKATTVETVFRGKRHDPSFVVKGELKPWQDAMALVYGNTPLETLVATSFAAPLVELAGSFSLVVSAYSHLSGVGKSTAMQLAQAVWGHPRSGMSTLADTNNSMMKKIGDLKSLPVYWDELRTKDQLEKIIEIVFQVTQGKTKARLNKDITQAEAPTFTTMFVVASNHGIVDTVYSQTESTEAGGLRVFEIEPEQVQSRFTGYEANQLIIPLANNYGVAGSVYAEWLVKNKKVVTQALKAVSDDLNNRHQFQNKERFWAATMSTILLGATLANACGLAHFDVAKLSAYLDEMLAHQRAEMKSQEFATMQAAGDVVGLLQEMMDEIRGKNLIVTDVINYIAAGRPIPAQIYGDPNQLGDVWCQYGTKDGRVRVRVRPFNEWMRKRKLNPKQVLGMLSKQYIVTQSRQTIGAGVPFLDIARFGRAACYDFTPISSTHAPSHGSSLPN